MDSLCRLFIYPAATELTYQVTSLVLSLSHSLQSFALHMHQRRRQAENEAGHPTLSPAQWKCMPCRLRPYLLCLMGTPAPAAPQLFINISLALCASVLYCVLY